MALLSCREGSARTPEAPAAAHPRPTQRVVAQPAWSRTDGGTGRAHDAGTAIERDRNLADDATRESAAGATRTTTSGAASTVRPDAGSDGATYYSEKDLRRLAGKTRSLKGGRLLVCGDADNVANCVCLEPLTCGKDGCPTWQQTVETFRASLAAKEKGRKVECRRAEVGTCGSFRYFDFEGDIERHELTLFDGSGRQIAQRNSTDYPEYCGGVVRTRFQGQVARCGPMKRDELICGAGEYPLPTPIEDVLKRTLPIEGSRPVRAAP